MFSRAKENNSIVLYDIKIMSFLFCFIFTVSTSLWFSSFSSSYFFQSCLSFFYSFSSFSSSSFIFCHPHGCFKRAGCVIQQQWFSHSLTHSVVVRYQGMVYASQGPFNMWIEAGLNWWTWLLNGALLLLSHSCYSSPFNTDHHYEKDEWTSIPKLPKKNDSLDSDFYKPWRCYIYIFFDVNLFLTVCWAVECRPLQGHGKR